jgi:hypothetical protein
MSPKDNRLVGKQSTLNNHSYIGMNRRIFLREASSITDLACATRVNTICHYYQMLLGTVQLKAQGQHKHVQ